jgi:hypothetical protein
VASPFGRGVVCARHSNPGHLGRSSSSGGGKGLAVSASRPFRCVDPEPGMPSAAVVISNDMMASTANLVPLSWFTVPRQDDDANCSRSVACTIWVGAAVICHELSARVSVSVGTHDVTVG